MSTQARVSNDERGKPRLVNGQHGNVNKDNWLGFVGDVVNFTGEVYFKSMLRIDGQFSGSVTSQDGTLIIRPDAVRERPEAFSKFGRHGKEKYEILK